MPIPAEQRQPQHERAHGGQQHLLGDQHLARDEAPQQPREHALLALQRNAPRRQQHPHEHQRDRHGDDHGEAVQRRAAAVQELALDRDRLPDGGQHPPAGVEVLGGEAGHFVDLAQLRAGLAGRLAGDDPFERGGDRFEADRQLGDADFLQVSAPQQPFDRARGHALDLFGEGEVALGDVRFDLRADQRLFQRVAVVDHFQGRPLGAGGHARGEAGGDHDRRRHVPALDFRDRVGAARGLHGVRLAEQFVGVAGHVELLAAELDHLARRGFVDDRHPRPRRPPRQRQADQHRDHQRVDDQQHQQQPRAAEDQQVLAQQRPHAGRPSPRDSPGPLAGSAPAHARGRRPAARLRPAAARRGCRRSAPDLRRGPARGARGDSPR